jgi:alpha-methylacyl-CoA racemase
MVDGVSSLLATTHGYASAGAISEERGSNFMDGGAPYYTTYRCSDGGYVAVGAVEPVFFGRLVEALGVDIDPEDQLDRSQWPRMERAIAEVFATRSRDEWAQTFGEIDACVSPVLSLREAAGDAQLVARDTLITRDGVTQPAPSPRFAATPGSIGRPTRQPGQDTTDGLLAWGVAPGDITRLLEAGVVVAADG